MAGELKPITVYSREAFFMKASEVKKIHDKIVDTYTFRFYEEKSCQKCEFYDERKDHPQKHLDVCDNCAAYRGGSCLTKKVKLGENTYVSTPAGDYPTLKRLLKEAGFEPELKLKHAKPPMERKIKFTGTLKDFQEEAVDAILEKKRGIIKAPPRSGKTVLSTAAVCRIGQKTIIVAAQRAWLLGFRETFIGSKTQKPLTNAKPEQVGLCTKYEDFLKYDVCLATPHIFRSTKGQKLLKKVRDMFGVLIVDEVHNAAANKYAMVIARLNVKYRIGLSGTPSRKDNKFVLVDKLMGRIIYDAKVEKLRPTIRLVRTDYTKTYKGQVMWPRVVSALENDKKRQKLIAKWALKDISNGHMVLILLAQVKPIRNLIKVINELAGKKVAYPFYGGLKKTEQDDNIEKARRYKIKVLVGNTKMLSTGVNIPRASALYDVTPSSNMENCEQRVARVLTPFEDKPPPIVRYFLDDMNIRRRCLSAEFWGCVKPKFKPIMSDVDYSTMKSYLATKHSNVPPRMEF